MAKRPIAGKITVSEGITTVDLHVGAQTVRLTTEQAHEVARELDMVATTLDFKIRAAKKKPKGATPTPPRDSTRGHDVAGRRAGSSSYHLCGGLPLAGIGADVRGSREIPAWNLRRDHVCYRDFGLVVPALNAFQGLILAGAPRQVRRWAARPAKAGKRPAGLVRHWNAASASLLMDWQLCAKCGRSLRRP